MLSLFLLRFGALPHPVFLNERVQRFEVTLFIHRVGDAVVGAFDFDKLLFPESKHAYQLSLHSDNSASFHMPLAFALQS